MTPKQIKNFSFLMNQIYTEMFCNSSARIHACSKESYYTMREIADERLEDLNDEPYEIYSFKIFSIYSKAEYTITATCNEVIVTGEDAVLLAEFSEETRSQNRNTLIDSHVDQLCKCNSSCSMATFNHSSSLIELLGLPDNGKVNIIFGSADDTINLYEILTFALVDLDGAAQGNKLLPNEIEPHYFREVEYPKGHFISTVIGSSSTKH